jgi:hypothetical protein
VIAIGPRAGRICSPLVIALVAVFGASPGVSLAEAAPPATPQRVMHETFTFKDAAPENVRGFAQTRDGYLWLGTATACSVSTACGSSCSGPRMPSGCSRPMSPRSLRPQTAACGWDICSEASANRRAGSANVQSFTWAADHMVVTTPEKHMAEPGLSSTARCPHIQS